MRVDDSVIIRRTSGLPRAMVRENENEDMGRTAETDPKNSGAAREASAGDALGAHERKPRQEMDEGSSPSSSAVEEEEGNADLDRGVEASAENLEEEMVQLQREMDELRDQHLRLAADFENYRKRVSQEMTHGWARAQADLVAQLIDGLDDLRRVSGFTSEDTTVEALIEGVDLVERKFLKALNEAGLEILDPEGEPFDPNTMEAMMRVPTEEEGQDEIVHQVLQKGYLFKDQLVRPARVSVYKDED